MAATVRHVRKRKGVFYYERRVPSDIVRQTGILASYFGGSALYRRSLRTKDAGAVHAAADLERALFENRVAEARGLPPSSEPTALRNLVDASALERVRTAAYGILLRPWTQAYILAEQSEAHADEFERMVGDREMFAEEDNEALISSSIRVKDPRHPQLQEEAATIIERERLNAPLGSEERGLVIAALRSGYMDAEKAIDALIKGQLPSFVTKQKSSLSPPKELTLRSAVEDYLADRCPRPKTARDARLSAEEFDSIVGDRNLSQLQPSHFRAFVAALAQREVGGNSRGSVRRKTSAATITKKVGLLRTSINHAVHKGNFDGANPAAGIKISAWAAPRDKSKSPNKRPFTVRELGIIFQHPWFVGCRSKSKTHEVGNVRLKGAEFWAPMLALYTGCRASELGGLKISEVDLDSAHPSLTIKDNEFRPTKGAYARVIPILDRLLSLGFRDYIESQKALGHQRVFPDWEPPLNKTGFSKDDARWSNARVIRSFNRTVIHQMIGKQFIAGARQEVTFHSFRGAFKSMLGLQKHSLSPNIINQILGHSKGELDNAYVGTIDIEDTYEAVHACDWHGLTLPVSPIPKRVKLVA